MQTEALKPLPYYERNNLEILLAFAGGASIATVLLMLSFTFHYRVNRYVNWIELEHLGQFWSGIFSPLALFALITGLYYQQRQMQEQRLTQDEDRQHFSEQMKIFRLDLTQKSFELAQRQLQEYAGELVFQEPPLNGTSSAVKKGLGEIIRILETVDDDDFIGRVVIDRTQIIRYLRMAQSAETLLAELPDNLRVAHVTQLEQLHPAVLDKVAQQLEIAREQCLHWVQEEFKRVADDELRMELEAYIDRDWLFEKNCVGQDVCVVATLLKPGDYKRLQSRRMPALAECCREITAKIRHTH